VTYAAFEAFTLFSSSRFGVVDCTGWCYTRTCYGMSNGSSYFFLPT
jgi:hypothetical protein